MAVLSQLFATQTPTNSAVPISDGSGDPGSSLDDWVSDGSSIFPTAEEVSYSNGSSGLAATNVQDAIDELALSSGSGVAPSDAEYIIRIADTDLPNAQVLGLLATGLLSVATATGVVASVTTSAGLAALITDETGTQFLVFSDSPVFTTQVTLPKIVWTGAVIDRFGTGTPEGVVTAGIGSVFRRTDGGTSTTIYIKESGAGNTGWVAISASGGTGDVVGTPPSTTNAFSRYTDTTGLLIKNSPVVCTDSGIVTITATASGPIVINNTSGQGYIIFQVSGSNKGLIGANNGVDGSVTGPDGALYLRAINNSILLSGDNGTTVGLSVGATNLVTVIDLTITRAATGGFVLNTTSGQPYWLIQISGSNYGLIGVNNGSGAIITGSDDKDIVIRAITAGISFSSDNGSSVAGRFVTTTGQFLLPKGIASTSTTTGTLVVTGGVGVSGSLNVGGVLRINQVTATNPTPPTGTLLHLTAADSALPIITFDAFAQRGVIQFRRASGTSASPSAVQSGDNLGNFGGIGYGATGYGASSTCAVTFLATQNFTDSAQGTKVTIEATANGSTTRAAVVEFASAGIRFNNYGAGTLTTDSSGNITATSDARAKQTIGNFTTGLDAVRRLQPKKYHWKESTGLNTDDVNVSIYAQDLITAGIPEAVATERTVAETEVVIENGGPERRERRDPSGRVITQRITAEFYSVSDRAVIAALVNAIKELLNRVETLESITRAPGPPS